MNIVLAQIKKDILCQKTVLIVWGICVALGIVAIAVMGVLSDVPKPDVENQRATLGILLSLGGLSMVGIGALAIGMFLLVPILVVLIVQEDLLMGTTAFWLTRPIPREKLLAAKAILIAVLPIPLLFIWSRFQGNSSAYSYGESHPFSAITETLHINPTDLFHLCYFVGFSAVFVHQYLTLRTKISLAILIATIAVVSVLEVLLG
jgi:ABC-type transport system involved in multi-copper enzyme maturation permease subunit